MKKILNNKTAQKLIVSTVFSLIMFILLETGIFTSQLNLVSDALYQQHSAPNSEIIIVGIDERALNEFDTWPWTRDVMAKAIEYLNFDPEKRPAVIGIDSLYEGEGENAEFDDYLAEVSGKYGNVVTASFAEFGTSFVENSDGTAYMDSFSILAYEEPYKALRDATEQGHINAMLDSDGILRHALWQLNLPDGREIPSFNQIIYKKYMAHIGESATSIPPMNEQGFWYVPFNSKPFSFDDGISVVDLYNETLDSDIFADKIVLIGPYTTGLLDSYPTAIDRATHMYGVEYQANAISALIDGNLKTVVPRLPQDLLILAISFSTFLWFYERKVWQALIIWVGLTFGLVYAYIFAFNNGYVLTNVLFVPVSITSAFILSIATNYTLSIVEKRKITSTFRRYVAPEVVSELLKDDSEALELGGKEVDIAVLFVDIRGFTTLSEKIKAPVVVEILNRYLTLTGNCVFENNGTLDKFIGDSTMAFWGAPLKQDDYVYKAVKTAIDMVHGGEKLAKEIEDLYGVSIGFGVGVNCGKAVVGNIGSTTRMDYTAIGDTVNTAARLESNAKKGEILVSFDVAREVEGRVKLTSLGSDIKLKGKTNDFEIFRVETT